MNLKVGNSPRDCGIPDCEQSESDHGGELKSVCISGGYGYTLLCRQLGDKQCSRRSKTSSRYMSMDKVAALRNQYNTARGKTTPTEKSPSTAQRVDKVMGNCHGELFMSMNSAIEAHHVSRFSPRKPYLVQSPAGSCSRRISDNFILHARLVVRRPKLLFRLSQINLTNQFVFSTSFKRQKSRV